MGISRLFLMCERSPSEKAKVIKNKRTLEGPFILERKGERRERQKIC